MAWEGGRGEARKGKGDRRGEVRDTSVKGELLRKDKGRKNGLEGKK